MSGNLLARDLAGTILDRNASIIEQTLSDRTWIESSPGGVGDSASGFDAQTLIGDVMRDQTPTELAAMSEDHTIGKYQVRKVLQGGMGVVYLAFDPMIEREVALKVLSADVARSPSSLQRFLTEARSIGRLNHPNVVSIYEISEWNGLYYLVMELLTGGSADELIQRETPPSWQEACRIVAEAARGLAAAHAAGMVHRDVKPANLMLSRNGTVKVVDFGLSKFLDSESPTVDAVTRAGQLLGTPHFMSPEQFDGVAVDAKADIYALGGTFYQLLTGQFPYQSCVSIMQLMKAHLLMPVPRASDLVARLPVGCDRIISTAMGKDPAARYATCDEMAAELEMLIRSEAQVRSNIVETINTSSAQADSVQTGRQVERRVFENGDRCLRSALVVEPSRLQAAMRKDLMLQAGAKAVSVGRSAAEAQAILKDFEPDVIWTAMELPDGRSLDWLTALAAQQRLTHSTVVVNSSDCTLAELAGIGTAGSMILAPRTARLESIIRVIHGAGPVRFTDNAMTAPMDPATAPVRLICDTSTIPEGLRGLLSRMGLSDVEIPSSSQPSSRRPSKPYLTILIRSAATLPGDAAAYAAMVSLRRSEMAAAVQSVSGQLILRAVGHDGVVATMNRPLDQSALESLLQAGR